MKKVMIAVALVGAAVMSQAADFKWATAKGQYIYAMNGTDKVTSGNAYLFYAADASKVFTAWDAGKTAVSSIAGSLDNSAITTAGAIAAKTSAPVQLAVDTLDAIFATEITVSGTKYLYISGASSVASITPGIASLSFSSTQLANSKLAAKDYSKGYKGDGWYTTSGGGDVPEPTSGILLLLGMAGLALRRRRA